MPDERTYDEEVARYPGRRLSRQDIQRIRYGFKLDEIRYERRATFFRWVKIIGTVAATAAAVAKALEVFHIHL